ncbi:unnamed protein product [marine sediment metagenome]|uniref:Uncharacterized protein n=1 Tax=marine sediment metagenome TaxID=412755 RepID=X1IE24_9ZZZZ
MIRKLTCVLVGLLLVAGVVVFVGSPVNAAKKTEVILWGGLDPVIPGGGREQLKTWNATHPEIKLVPQAATAIAGQTLSMVAKLMIAIAAEHLRI